MDLFNEKIIKKQKNALDILIIVLIILAALVAVFSTLSFLQLIAPIAVAGIVFGAYYLITMRNIEYEYAVTNGDIDIDIIINQRRRKRLFSANCKDFEKVARVKSEHFDKQIKECKNIKNYWSGNENADVWFIYLKQGEPLVILFEPSKEIIYCFRTFIPRRVFR